MVNIVSDWEMLEEYAEWCRIGQYQVSSNLDGKEVRVLVGRFGFVKTFADEKEPILDHIIKFCKHNHFVKVVDSIPEEIFFKGNSE